MTHVVDGDTLDVRIGDRTERVRLLNIDTPEVTGPEADEQCLGPEATAQLTSLVPVGTPVRLEFDQDRTDGYGRTLAGVFTQTGVLVNAEMARAGLAVPVVVGENDRFHPPVVEARDEAAAQGRGLFSPEVTCTLPGQVAAVITAPDVAAHPPGASSEELGASVDAASAALSAARALEDAVLGESVGAIRQVFTRDELDRIVRQVGSLRETAQQRTDALREAQGAALAREAAARQEAARQEAARQEAARIAEEKRRARAAEEQREARQAEERRQAAEAERRSADAEPEQARPRPQKPDPEPSAGGDPYPGYTGPRCYAPGGKTWKPC